jgi:hypothetical protein
MGRAATSRPMQVIVFTSRKVKLSIKKTFRLCDRSRHSVGEFRKTRHPQNVEFNEVREMSFSGARHS